ncbi:S9 family peptidase [Plebeiibacterium sediminum]|uniref:S9 family peptidase n=1 Tax=Plebeiibacterium sediminum TaxID=2992112 RepID=A0AAE3M3M7_9BACT|nr:DPP IV N-terminal domain-containing protein [Plebeiobacterium sediminum]MCW3786473.1 S9 family peptidase [Plebeiobacterium sediminum]
MKVFYFTLLTFFLCLVGLNAQNKLELEDVISGGKNFRNFIPKYVKYEFLPGTDSLVLFQRDTIFYVEDQLEKSSFLTLKQVNDLFSNSDLSKLNSLYPIKWITSNSYYVNLPGAIVIADVNSDKVKYIINYPKEAEFLSFNPVSRFVAYLNDGDLFVVGDDNKSVLVEKAESKDIVLGQTVHRNEFGISGGIFWSPNGKSLAFYRKDESMVTDYPLVNINERVAKVENIKYPMAGMDSHHVTIGVFNAETKEKLYLETGLPKEKFLTNVSWSPDEKYIGVAELNRAQNHMHYNLYNVADGSLFKTLFEEKSDKWVEPENPAVFVPNSNTKFVWQSERDGYNHFYLYDINKGLLKQITKGEWVVTDNFGFDAKGNTLFFEGTKDDVMNRHLYSVSMKNGKVNKLSSAQGFHSVVLNDSKNKVLDYYSSLNVPRVIELYDVKKKTKQVLFKAENPFEEYDFGKVELGTIKSADGITDLNYRLILPANFDVNKKYPVVVYVYGGPHSQQVNNSWLGGARYWQLYMAQNGYICFTMDNRGTPDRGCDFEKVIHRQLGECETQDQYEGVKFLKSLPYVDQDRIGVHGWSFGGFMTINLMEKYPNDFKVGVSGGPVIDWKYYEIMYGERYMDTPDENPEGYEKSNLNLRVDNLQGRLLVIHGAIDPTVVWQHSLQFIEHCIKKRKQVDYFVYPRHEHNVLGPDRVHLMEKVTQYFKDFL